MNTKFKALLCVFALSYVSTNVYAGDVKKGLALFKQNHYNEAVAELMSAIPSSGDNIGLVNLTLGMNLQHSARFHSALQRESVDAQVKYLELVKKSKGDQKSAYAALYYGEALLESGDYKNAKKELYKVVKGKNSLPQHKMIANINIGLIDYMSKKATSAKNRWSKIKSKDSDVLSELAAAYSRVGYNSKVANGIIDKAMSGKKHSARLLANAINVYADSGRIDDGLSLTANYSLDGYVEEEVLGKNKKIKFYETSLLAGISKLHNSAAQKYLALAANDAKYKEISLYYMAEAGYFGGDMKMAEKSVAEYIRSGKSTFMTKAKGLQDAIYYRNGNKKIFSNMKEFDSPVSANEYLLSCARVKADCNSSASAVEKLLQDQQGTSARNMNYALGEYYLRLGKPDISVSFLEEARDKSRKNKIEGNDPVMLVSIAEAYGKNKLYSESLEIYFEMSKEFPVVRQIQDAVQGIYSTEQKSAGDVKIF